MLCARNNAGPGSARLAQSLRRFTRQRKGGSMEEHEHPKGALLFILVFLLILVVFWINTYLRLWLRS
jgi:hypothetical protein